MADANPGICDPLRYVYIAIEKKVEGAQYLREAGWGVCRHMGHTEENPATQVHVRGTSGH